MEYGMRFVLSKSKTPIIVRADHISAIYSEKKDGTIILVSGVEFAVEGSLVEVVERVLGSVHFHNLHLTHTPTEG